MRMFITSKNKYLSNDMKIFGTCSIPLIEYKFIWKAMWSHGIPSVTNTCLLVPSGRPGQGEGFVHTDGGVWR